MKKLSTEEMRKIICDRVSFKDRMDSVYIPMIAQDCACYLCDNIIKLLREMRREDTRRMCRELNNTVTSYRSTLMQVMRKQPGLYESVQSKSRSIYDWIGQDMYIHILQYTQELHRLRCPHNTQVIHVLSEAYVVRKIIGYVLQLDRDFSKKISAQLPVEVQYKTDDNEYCLLMDKTIANALKVFSVPDTLDSVNIQLSYQIFQKKLSQCHIGYEEKEMTKEEREKYNNGYCRCEDCRYYPMLQEGICCVSHNTIDTERKKKCWRKCEEFNV